MQELRNIEHPIRLYRVIAPQGGGAPSVQGRARVRSPGVSLESPFDASWADAFLHPSSLAPLLIGAYLLATALGLPPSGRMFPAYGAVLVGVGVGNALRRRTGRRGLFQIALGAGLVVAAVSGHWRSGPPWWLLLGGIVIVVVGLTHLRTRRHDRP